MNQVKSWKYFKKLKTWKRAQNVFLIPSNQKKKTFSRVYEHHFFKFQPKVFQKKTFKRLSGIPKEWENATKLDFFVALHIRTCIINTFQT